MELEEDGQHYQVHPLSWLLSNNRLERVQLEVCCAPFLIDQVTKTKGVPDSVVDPLNFTSTWPCSAQHLYYVAVYVCTPFLQLYLFKFQSNSIGVDERRWQNLLDVQMTKMSHFKQ